jgi:hypothetical protein
MKWMHNIKIVFVFHLWYLKDFGAIWQWDVDGDLSCKNLEVHVGHVGSKILSFSMKQIIPVTIHTEQVRNAYSLEYSQFQNEK